MLEVGSGCPGSLEVQGLLLSKASSARRGEGRCDKFGGTVLAQHTLCPLLYQMASWNGKDHNCLSPLGVCGEKPGNQAGQLALGLCKTQSLGTTAEPG